MCEIKRLNEGGKIDGSTPVDMEEIHDQRPEKETQR